MNSLKSGLNKLKGIFIDEDGQMTWITAVIGYGLCIIILIAAVLSLYQTRERLEEILISSREVSERCLELGYPDYIITRNKAYCVKLEDNSDVVIPLSELGEDGQG